MAVVMGSLTRISKIVNSTPKSMIKKFINQKKPG